MKRVTVDIARLVLTGLGPQDRYVIAASLQAELERVIGSGNYVSNLQAMGNVSRLHVGDVGPDSVPQRIGVNVARGIAKEIVQ